MIRPWPLGSSDSCLRAGAGRRQAPAAEWRHERRAGAVGFTDQQDARKRSFGEVAEVNDDWQGRFDALLVLDDEDAEGYEDALDKLGRDWTLAYCAAFIEIAIERGWKGEDAATWPHEIADEAFLESYRFGRDPRQSALADVIACEAERP